MEAKLKEEKAKGLLALSVELYRRMDESGIRLDLERVKRGIVEEKEVMSQILANHGLEKVSELEGEVRRLASEVAEWPKTGNGKLRLTMELLDGRPEQVMADYAEVLRARRSISVLERVQERGKGGRIYTEHHIHPDRGRVMPGNFNYWTLKKSLRGIVLAESSQDVWEVSLCGIEIVVLAYLSGDRELRVFCSSLGVSSHSEEEKGTRAAIYGRMYGYGILEYAKALGIRVEDAVKWQNDVAAKYSVAWAYLREAGEKAEQEGAAESAFGLVRSLALEVKPKRAAIAHLIQSTAAELTRMGASAVSEVVSGSGRVWGMVPDAYLLSIPKSIKKVDGLITVVDNFCVEWGFPVNVRAVNWGDCWGSVVNTGALEAS